MDNVGTLFIHNKTEWNIITNFNITKEIDFFKATPLKGTPTHDEFGDANYLVKKVIKNRFDYEIPILDKLKEINYRYSHQIYRYGKDEKEEHVYIYMKDENYNFFNGIKFNEEELSKIVKSLLNAVLDLHSKGIIHRDIKCSNIMFSKNDHTVIFVDFSCSKLLKDSYLHSEYIGTETHMAPEVRLQNGKAGFKSDSYSLGCALIEMIGGDLKERDGCDPKIPDNISNTCKNFILSCLVFNIDGRFTIQQLLNHKFIIGFSKQDPNDIPNSVTSLTFGYDLNQPLKPNDIPNSVASLKFGYLFNQPLKPNDIPNSITTLTFGDYFNQPLKPNDIPNSVTSLTFGYHFNQPLQPNDIPNSVTTLTFGVYFNQPLKPNDIPNSVTSLTFGDCFNQPLKANDIPNRVTSLTFGYNFDQHLKIDSIPSSVTNLDLGNIFDLFKNGENLPNSILKLTSSYKFTKPLVSRYYPPSTTQLILYNYNQPLVQNTVSNLIISLTLGSCFNDIESLKFIPKSLLNLKFETSKLFDFSILPKHINLELVISHYNGDFSWFKTKGKDEMKPKQTENNN